MSDESRASGRGRARSGKVIGHWPDGLWAKTSGCRIRFGDGIRVVGQPGVSATKPACSNSWPIESQLLGRSQRPWTNTTALAAGPLARTTSWARARLMLGVVVMMLSFRWAGRDLSTPPRSTKPLA